MAKNRHFTGNYLRQGLYFGVPSGKQKSVLYGEKY